MPIRRKKKAKKRNAGTIVLTQTTYVKVNLGIMVLIPVAHKTIWVKRAAAKKLFDSKYWYDAGNERHTMDVEQ